MLKGCAKLAVVLTVVAFLAACGRTNLHPGVEWCDQDGRYNAVGDRIGDGCAKSGVNWLGGGMTSGGGAGNGGSFWK